jgi:small-conductance mechanosensitive channel
MTTDSQPVTAGRVLIRFLLAIAGIIAGLFCYFVCQGMFSGYPQYGAGILSDIGLLLIMAIGGVAWIIDHRRIDADEQ